MSYVDQTGFLIHAASDIAMIKNKIETCVNKTLTEIHHPDFKEFRPDSYGTGHIAVLRHEDSWYINSADLGSKLAFAFENEENAKTIANVFNQSEFILGLSSISYAASFAYSILQNCKLTSYGVQDEHTQPHKILGSQLTQIEKDWINASWEMGQPQKDPLGNELPPEKIYRVDNYHEAPAHRVILSVIEHLLEENFEFVPWSDWDDCEQWFFTS